MVHEGHKHFADWLELTVFLVHPGSDNVDLLLYSYVLGSGRWME